MLSHPMVFKNVLGANVGHRRDERMFFRPNMHGAPTHRFTATLITRLLTTLCRTYGYMYVHTVQ